MFIIVVTSRDQRASKKNINDLMRLNWSSSTIAGRRGANCGVIERRGVRTLEERDAEDPRRPEERRHEPRGGHHEAHAAAGATRPVGERPRDGEVAVDADEQQVGDARVRHRVVHLQPTHAHQAPERPAPQRQLHRVQCHRQHADLRAGAS